LVQEALDARRGLVLMTPHLGSFEVCAQAYAARFGRQAPLTALYRPARKAWLREVQEISRNRPGLKTAPATLAGVRTLVRALKAGETIGVLPDQVPPEGLGSWTPFFGAPAYTMTLASRLVQQTGARVVILWGERRPRGRGWVVHALDPAALLPQGQSWDAQPEQINQVMEAVIRRAPHQYLWGYHRFKAPRSVPAARTGG
jgi:KDO2-lipid IV(A) lauroyltransferase